VRIICHKRLQGSEINLLKVFRFLYYVTVNYKLLLLSLMQKTKSVLRTAVSDAITSFVLLKD